MFEDKGVALLGLGARVCSCDLGWRVGVAPAKGSCTMLEIRDGDGGAISGDGIRDNGERMGNELGMK